MGRRVGITHERYEHASDLFKRRGEVIIVVARFIEVLRQLNGIIAGTLEMPWHVFVAYNALGAALWVGTWTAAGYFAGEHVDRVQAVFHQYSVLLLLATTVAYAIWTVVRWSRDLRAL
jgi:membrane protein DedA with SNARE-associated domain